MPSKKRRSVVTGGSGVLGQCIIKELTKRGDDVICLDRVPPEGDASNYIEIDATDPLSVKAAMEKVHSRLKGIDNLIHTIGILRGAPFLEISDEDMRGHYDVNFMSAFRVGQTAARMMLGQGGRIVFITSIHGQVGVPERGAYAASKGAIASLARVMAVELAPEKIRVNVLAPGAIDGGMQPNAKTRTGWVSATPSKRVAQLEEISRVATMLTSDDASFINGQIISVDGGASTLRPFS